MRAFREAAGAQAGASARQHGPAEMIRERRFPDALLARDEDDLPVSALRRTPALVEHRLLDLPPEDLRGARRPRAAALGKPRRYPMNHDGGFLALVFEGAALHELELALREP